jgi:hypothetical protein
VRHIDWGSGRLSVLPWYDDFLAISRMFGVNDIRPSAMRKRCGADPRNATGSGPDSVSRGVETALVVVRAYRQGAASTGDDACGPAGSDGKLVAGRADQAHRSFLPPNCAPAAPLASQPPARGRGARPRKRCAIALTDRMLVRTPLKNSGFLVTLKKDRLRGISRFNRDQRGPLRKLDTLRRSGLRNGGHGASRHCHGSSGHNNCVAIRLDRHREPAGAGEKAGIKGLNCVGIDRSPI